MASSQNDLLQMLLRNAVTADNPKVAANAPDILSGNFQKAIAGAGGGNIGQFVPQVAETAPIPGPQMAQPAPVPMQQQKDPMALIRELIQTLPMEYGKNPQGRVPFDGISAQYEEPPPLGTEGDFTAEHDPYMQLYKYFNSILDGTDLEDDEFGAMYELMQ